MSTTSVPLGFFGQALSDAEGAQFTPEKYMHMLDDLFAAAVRDPEIQAVMVFRKGDNVAVMGVKEGQLITEPGDFRSVLLPVLQRM